MQRLLASKNTFPSCRWKCHYFFSGDPMCVGNSGRFIIGEPFSFLFSFSSHKNCNIARFIVGISTPILSLLIHNFCNCFSSSSCKFIFDQEAYRKIRTILLSVYFFKPFTPLWTMDACLSSSLFTILSHPVIFFTGKAIWTKQELVFIV